MLRRKDNCSSRSEDGQDLVEYALILPLLLFLLLGIMEFGVAVFTYNTLANAAREGARAAIIPTASEATVEDAVGRLTTGLNRGAIEIGVSGVPCSGGAPITVTVAYTYTLMTGGFLGAGTSIPLSAQATMICDG